MLLGGAAEDDGDSGNPSEPATQSASDVDGTSDDDPSGDDTAADDACLPSGEGTEAAECCGGTCRQDGVCGTFECSADGETCTATCCGAQLCDMETQTCSATCIDVDGPCTTDDDCCSQACVPGSGTGAGLG